MKQKPNTGLNVRYSGMASRVNMDKLLAENVRKKKEAAEKK